MFAYRLKVLYFHFNIKLDWRVCESIFGLLAYFLKNHNDLVWLGAQNR